MTAIQLEFNIDNDSEADVKLNIMQKQIDEMHESMGKVRRRLFSEMGEMKKLCLFLKSENDDLRIQLKELKNEKTEWVYKENGYLFNVQEHQKAFS